MLALILTLLAASTHIVVAVDVATTSQSIVPAPGSVPVGPEECPAGQWFWKSSVRVCLPHLTEHRLERHDGIKCPINWYWHWILGHCAPPVSGAESNRCESGFHKHYARLICLENPSLDGIECLPDQWLWEAKPACLPKDYENNNLLVQSRNDPRGVCPYGWRWHLGFDHCAPTNQKISRAACPDEFVLDNTQFICVRNPSLPLRECPPGQWFMNQGQKCLPEGGHGTAPPNLMVTMFRHACPEFWYWHPDGHCAPPFRKNLGSRCPEGYNWIQRLLSCQRPPRKL